MVRVFLCWSGDRSRRTAAALKEWLEMVFQGAHVFLSENTIKGGQRWQDELQAALEHSATGLCILNGDNTKNQWIAFEAGSLAKTKEGRVTPILCGIGDGALKDGPLAQFQAKHLSRSGLETLAKELNESHGSPVPAATLERTLKAMWTPYGEAILEADKVSGARVEAPTTTPLDEVMVRLDRLERSLPDTVSEAVHAAVKTMLEDNAPRAIRSWQPKGSTLTSHTILSAAQRKAIEQMLGVETGTIATAKLREGKVDKIDEPD